MVRDSVDFARTGSDFDIWFGHGIPTFRKMNAVYEELDETKAEIERLREQYRAKVELAERLKRAHCEELNKNKEASTKLEKLAQELGEKDDEAAEAKQMYEELRSCLTEKESTIKNLTSAYDKLRFDCNEKLRKCEEDNKALASALDDANAKNMDQEKKICTLKLEVECVKNSLTFSQNKCLETENKGRVLKEVKGREDEFLKLEDENREFEDQLKWKKEQFCHLQEAHQKLQSEHRTREKEWEKDRAELLDVISSLELKLESQTRISRDLECQLEMCNQALAHAESKRKMLEVQLLESNTCLDTICAELDDAKLNSENLSAKRDQDIALLRSSLSTKEVLYKEMEYQFRKREQEKQDLFLSLKELQEAQIRDAGFVSASKLQKKLKSLELLHKGCEINLKAKESEWQSQMEKLLEELNICRTELTSKDLSLREMNRELQACDSLMLKLETMNQEISMVLLILKSEFSEVQARFADEHSSLILKNNQLQEHICKLVDQKEKKKAAIDSVQKDLEGEREKVLALSRKVQTLEELESPLQKEVDRLKEMLKESTANQFQSQEQVLLIKSDLEKVHDALDRANEELYDKFCEANEIEFELQVWKSLAEQLEASLKQNRQMRKEVEASLLSQTEVELDLKQEKESLSQQLEENEKRIDNLQQQLHEVKESKSMKVQETCPEHKFEVADAEEDADKHETEETLHQVVEEKDQRIYDLQQCVESLEEEFESSSSSFSSRLTLMQKEIRVLRASWEKIKETEVFKEVEIQEKNIMITVLEDDVQKLLHRMEQQENAISTAEKKIQEIQAKLDKKVLETHKLERKLKSSISTSDETIEKLAQSSIHLSSENKNMVNSMALLFEKMELIIKEDTQLAESFGNIYRSMDICRPLTGWHSDDEEEDPLKENAEILSCHSMKKKAETLHDDGRLPLRAINN